MAKRMGWHVTRRRSTDMELGEQRLRRPALLHGVRVLTRTASAWASPRRRLVSPPPRAARCNAFFEGSRDQPVIDRLLERIDKSLLELLLADHVVL